MMYADDLIIMSESHEGFQESFNRLEKYCEQWGLTVNVSKTEHMNLAMMEICKLPNETYTREAWRPTSN